MVLGNWEFIFTNKTSNKEMCCAEIAAILATERKGENQVKILFERRVTRAFNSKLEDLASLDLSSCTYTVEGSDPNKNVLEFINTLDKHIKTLDKQTGKVKIEVTGEVEIKKDANVDVRIRLKEDAVVTDTWDSFSDVPVSVGSLFGKPTVTKWFQKNLPKYTDFNVEGLGFQLTDELTVEILAKLKTSIITAKKRVQEEDKENYCKVFQERVKGYCCKYWVTSSLFMAGCIALIWSPFRSMFGRGPSNNVVVKGEHEKVERTVVIFVVAIFLLVLFAAKFLDSRRRVASNKRCPEIQIMEFEFQTLQEKMAA